MDQRLIARVAYTRAGGDVSSTNPVGPDSPSNITECQVRIYHFIDLQSMVCQLEDLAEYIIMSLIKSLSYSENLTKTKFIQLQITRYLCNKWAKRVGPFRF